MGEGGSVIIFGVTVGMRYFTVTYRYASASCVSKGYNLEGLSTVPKVANVAVWLNVMAVPLGTSPTGVPGVTFLMSIVARGVTCTISYLSVPSPILNSWPLASPSTLFSVTVVSPLYTGAAVSTPTSMPTTSLMAAPIVAALLAPGGLMSIPGRVTFRIL